METVLWSAGNSSTISIKSWSDEELGLVFDAVSGDTHLLDQLAVEILQSLQKEPSRAEQLNQQLADRFSPDDQCKAAEFITTTLLQLRDIGLVVDTPV
jgi:PqqD family protein of HPr-rel-A system